VPLGDRSLKAVEKDALEELFPEASGARAGSRKDMRKIMESDTGAIGGVSFDYFSQDNIERVEFLLKQETQEIADKGIKKIKEQVSEIRREKGTAG
jgi:hypothetical protein